jgi:hypothetical protein
LLIFIQSGHNFSAIPVSLASLKKFIPPKSRGDRLRKLNPKKFGLWGSRCKETGSRVHRHRRTSRGLAWDIRVISLREQIDPDIS